jgi:hypothetical protein
MPIMKKPNLSSKISMRLAKLAGERKESSDPVDSHIIEIVTKHEKLIKLWLFFDGLRLTISNGLVRLEGELEVEFSYNYHDYPEVVFNTTELSFVDKALVKTLSSLEADLDRIPLDGATVDLETLRKQGFVSKSNPKFFKLVNQYEDALKQLKALPKCEREVVLYELRIN